MAAKSISIPVTGNTAPLRKALIAASAELNTFGNKAGAAAKKGALALAAMGTAAVVVGLKWTKMAELAAIADQRIEAVAHTMALFGAGTATTTKRIQDYADALERETGVTAETIKAAQAKLLTFRQLAVTADVAGGAFDRATQAAIDMAAAGFGEATTNAVQLGKALEDPIKGVNSLRRSGITFTESEKAKLAVLVQSNRIHDAQAVILTAIETQVKGTASATALSTQRMKNGFGEVTDAIGTKLLPVMNGIADALVAIGEKATLEGLGAAFEEVGNQASIALDKLNGKLEDSSHAADGTVSGFGRFQNGTIRFTNVMRAASNVFFGFTENLGLGNYEMKKHLDTLSTYTEGQKQFVKEEKEMAIYVQNLTKWQKEQDDIMRKAAKDKEIAAAAATAAAEKRAAAEKIANTKEKDRFSTFKDNLKAAKAAIQSYVDSISEAISREVNLGRAFNDAATDQTDAQSKVNDALQERRQAYQDLQQANASGDQKTYADALDRVAAAEKNVTDAQAIKPKNYTAIFQEQIAAAKNFAGYMKTLIAGGNMSTAAIQQLLELGPVAGATVAKDLIAGTGGFTAASLSADLQGVADAGTAAGMATPGFSAALGATAANGAGTGNFYITIESGIGDPTEIAKTVTAVLQTYGATTNGLPITVKTPKAAPKKTGRKVKK